VSLHLAVGDRRLTNTGLLKEKKERKSKRSTSKAALRGTCLKMLHQRTANDNEHGKNKGGKNKQTHKQTNKNKKKTKNRFTHASVSYWGFGYPHLIKDLTSKEARHCAPSSFVFPQRPQCRRPRVHN
jgi:hypothetical protein